MPKCNEIQKTKSRFPGTLRGSGLLVAHKSKIAGPVSFKFDADTFLNKSAQLRGRPRLLRSAWKEGATLRIGHANLRVKLYRIFSDGTEAEFGLFGESLFRSLQVFMRADH